MTSIEYSNSGSVWKSVPFVQDGNICYFDTIDARIIKLNDGVNLENAELSFDRGILDSQYSESDIAEHPELEETYRAYEALAENRMNSVYSVLASDEKKELDEKLDNFSAQAAATRISIAESISDAYSSSEAKDSNVATYMKNMTVPTSAYGFIWSDITGMNQQSAQLTKLYTRINNMALAYQAEDSSYYHSAELLEKIKTALSYADKYWYNSSTKMVSGGNWWDYIIGVPEQYTSALAIVWDELSVAEKSAYSAGLANFCTYDAYGGTTNLGYPQEGANLADIAKCDFVMGVLTADKSKTENAVSKYRSIFTYCDGSESTDGFYSDGSFLQHGIPYNGNYGAEFISAAMETAEYMSKTAWALNDEEEAVVCEWIDKGFMPFIRRGSIMDIVNGRSIARNNADKNNAYQIGRAIFHFAGFMSDETKKKEYIETVKYWFENSSESNGVTWQNNADPLTERMMADTSYSAVNHFEGGMFAYPEMDRVVYRPDDKWGMGIAMYSSRINSFELVNGENLKGWYTASGATYLYNSNDTQYSEDYWITADMYKIPGTTADSTERYCDGEGEHYQLGDGAWRSEKDFVGGLTDGKTGIYDR